MRVVALNTIHFAFNHGMMLGQIKFSLNFEVALKTRCRVFAGINDEFVLAAFDVFAARAVA